MFLLEECQRNFKLMKPRRKKCYKRHSTIFKISITKSALLDNNWGKWSWNL